MDNQEISENYKNLATKFTTSYEGLRILLTQFLAIMVGESVGPSFEDQQTQIFQEANKIVNHIQISIYPTLNEIYTYSFSLYQKFWKEITTFQSQRQSLTDTQNSMAEIIEQISTLKEKVAHISVLISSYLIENTDLNHNLSFILSRVPFEHKFRVYFSNLKTLQKTICKKFCLLLDSKPVSLINIGSPRDISVLYTSSLAQPKSNTIEIKTFLIHESTARDIQNANSVPESICRIANQTPLVNLLARSRQTHQICGKLFLDSYDSSTKSRKSDAKKYKKLRSAPSDRPYKNLRGQLVQIIMANKDETLTSYSFQRRLVITEKPGKNNLPATAKYCLLLVLDVIIDNEEQQVWTLSLPFCITTHVTQNEQCWLPIAWYDVVANHQEGLVDLQVQETASWEQIKQVLNNACILITGRPLEYHHFDFLMEKASQMIFESPIYLSDDTEISRDQLRRSSLWQYFYACLSVVRIDSPLNKIWMKCQIEGFISFENASQRLKDSLIGLNENEREAKVGQFIIRFSDTLPGGLTFVYLTKLYHQGYLITKFQPVDLLKKKMKECTVELLRYLKVKNPSSGNEAFQKLFPDNLSKEEVFKEFYDYAANNPLIWVQFWKEKGYVTSESQNNPRFNWDYRVYLSCFYSTDNN